MLVSLKGLALLGAGAALVWLAAAPPAAARSNPPPVVFNYSSIAAGDEHSCVIENETSGSTLVSQTVYCWGQNLAGQVGGTSGDPNNEMAQDTPVPVAGLGGTVTQLTAGAGYTCALLSNGQVQCWGWNYEGQLNPYLGVDSSTVPIYAPVSNITQVSAGDDHVCALNTSGQVLCWGDNSYGQLGGGPVDFRQGPVTVNLPYQAISVSAGRYFSCAVVWVPGGWLSTEAVYCWGLNDQAQLGDGSAFQQFNMPPTPVAGLPFFGTFKVAASFLGGCALSGAGTEYCWGDNNVGEIGVGPTQNAVAISAMAVPSSAAITVMATGVERFTNCSVMSGSGTYCWGDNYDDEFGLGSAPSQQSSYNTPQLVPGTASNNGFTAVSQPVEISIGAGHVCAIASVSSVFLHTSTQHVYCWGNNTYGQVGNGTENTIVTSPASIL